MKTDYKKAIKKLIKAGKAERLFITSPTLQPVISSAMDAVLLQYCPKILG